LFDPKYKMSLTYGTPYYIAPEVLAGSYDARCDVWSAGVIMYILLCGYPPFSAKTDEEIYDKIRKMTFDFPAREWKNISPDAKNLISSILVPQDRRPTAVEVYNHPWF
jgi:calcium-dependent protein kinase